MKYIKKNFMIFFSQERAIFFLVVLCVISSAFVINFAYGLYHNYNLLKEDEENDRYEFCVVFNNSESIYVSKKELIETLMSFSNELNQSVNMFYVEPNCEEWKETEMNRVTIRFCIDQGEIVPCELFEQIIEDEGTLYKGRYFTNQEEQNGERVALVWGDKLSDKYYNFTENLLVDDETILFQGNEYKIIGAQTIHPIIVPFNSLMDSTPINNIIFHFSKPIKRSQYDEIKEKMELNFPGCANVPELEFLETEDIYLYNTIILITISISMLSALNLAFLYKYILEKRLKTLVIFRICGCTKRKIFAIYLGECILIVIPLYILMTYLYDKLILNALGKNFQYIKSVYHFEDYILLAVIYIFISIIVLSVMIWFSALKKSIIEAKGGR